MKFADMFFEFVYAKSYGATFAISSRSNITSETNNYAKRYVEDVISTCPDEGKIMQVNLKLSIPEYIKNSVGKDFLDNEESYAVEIKGDVVNLFSMTDNGLIFAVSTLKQLVESGGISEALIYDYPDKSVRGYRVFTPGRESFQEFYRMVDMLVYYKYNSIIIEVGGAMEYKKHPEINEKWVEFCKEVHKSPNEAERIQKKTHPEWQKNSIHADNGNGSYITQDEMRKLIEYCGERGLSVIPEVPSLSHCDYIVMAHPDIRERLGDTYPDTYCPSNPKSYELVFDILDEIIDVFKPGYVNIGHDECYSLAKCPECVGKDPVELFVGDIEKINNYLRQKSVKSIMWAEKFFDNVYLPDENGVLHGYGGTGDEAWDVPRCIGCVGKVPKDVTLLHWYWSLCTGEEEKNIRDLGYRMIFGNFQASAMADYRLRSDGVDGGYVSNWGSFEEQYMQRNGQNYNLVATAWIFWSREYDTPMCDEVEERVKNELYKRYKKSLNGELIELLHTTDHYMGYKAFYDGYYIVPEDWEIGKHVVRYTDGTTAELPIVYGYNIRTGSEEVEKEQTSTESKPKSRIEVLGASYPVARDGRVFYKTAYVNPYPEKQIDDIFVSANDGINIDAVYSITE